MANFSLTQMALNMYFPGNVAQLDDAGLPSIMVWIPAFRLCDVLNTTDESIHPAFIVNGRQIPGFYYSKYENVVHNGKAYSLPAEDPANTINFDTAREYCEAKGYGWHMSTAAEWAAIALWCKKNGCAPYGNSNYGKDAREDFEKAISTHVNDAGNTCRVATGTGPLRWSHDNSMSGIWDLHGNVMEWQGGIRLVWGELQILANNDAADPDNPQNATSARWMAINATDGTLVEPESKTTDASVKTAGNTVKVDYVNGVWTFSSGISNASPTARTCRFDSVACSLEISDAAKVLLRALAMLPDTDTTGYDDDIVWWVNSSGEHCVLRGGCWDHGSGAGLFSVYGTDLRTDKYPSFGFRASYIPNI